MNKPSSLPRSILGADDREDRVAKPAGMRNALEHAPDFLEYWRRVMARKWLLLAIVSAMVILGLVFVQTRTPAYEATATVLIEDGGNNIVQIREFYSGTAGNRDHFTTQSEFIGSRNVAERVIQQLGLMRHPEFDPRQGSSSIVGDVLTWVTSTLLGKGEATALSERDLLNSVVASFSKKLNVEPLRATQLVKVHFLSEDPALAAEISNAITEAYITADMDARYAVTQQAHSWLSEQVSTLQRNLTASELALQAYRDSKGLIDKASAAQGGAARQLETFTQQLIEARVRRAQAEQQFKQIQGRSAAANVSAPPVLASPTVQRTRENLAQAERAMSEASQRFGPSHPAYRAAEADLEIARGSLYRAVEAVTYGIAKEYEAARAVEKGLEAELASSRGSILELNRDELELASYEQEVATNRQLYETFLGRLKETNIVRDIQTPIARVIDRAVPPSRPARPAKIPILLAFGVAGVILGIGVVLLRYRLDDTLSSIDQAENALDVPIVAALPHLKGKEARNIDRMVVKQPESGFSEAIRTTRTAIRLAMMGADTANVIMVTSSLPEEGKSTIALNLALAQSQVSRTLLVECDIRRPTLAKRLELPRGTLGLTECLKDRVAAEDCTVRARGSNLACMVAGNHREAPLELLLSKEFAALLAQLRSQYETIIIDTPPLALVSDGVTLAEQADGILLTIKAHDTPKRLVQRLLRTLSRIDTPVIGAVLNQLDVRRARKYYGEYGVYEAGSYGSYGRGNDAA